MAATITVLGAAGVVPVSPGLGNLPWSAQVLDDVRRVLGSKAEHRCGWWRRWPTQAFNAFAVPTD